MSREQLFASFIIDQDEGLEIALSAEHVIEATPIPGHIRPLPASIDFLEGIIHLRNDVIPVINMKKRLGLKRIVYSETAKVAVVRLFDQQIGLMFDDIKEVIRVGQQDIMPISSSLQTDDRIISALIKLKHGTRSADLLDLQHLFPGGLEKMGTSDGKRLSKNAEKIPVIYSRYVVFKCGAQEYGVPVKYSQEITFFTDINKMFKSGAIEGVLQLRGKTIPVLNAWYLLAGKGCTEPVLDGNCRVLVLYLEDCSFGMIVEEVKEILNVADDQVLSLPAGQGSNLTGIFAKPSGVNVMLLDMPRLICSQMKELKSIARINNGDNRQGNGSKTIASASHHLITENCYLVFAIEKNFAIELKDVQEIIENDSLMTMPGESGIHSGVINLRGQIVPVVNLRHFYGYPGRPEQLEASKLIICRGNAHTIALEVDRIVTIYKQEKYHTTPSLNPQLADKRDTLDRLIEFDGGNSQVEHVLVINMHNIIQNHLLLNRMDETNP